MGIKRQFWRLFSQRVGRYRGDQFTPLGNRSDADTERLRDRSSGLEVLQDVGFVHAQSIKHA